MPQYNSPFIILSSNIGENVVVTDQFDATKLTLFKNKNINLSTDLNRKLQAVEITINPSGASSLSCNTIPGNVNCADPTLKVVGGEHDISNYGAIPTTPEKPYDSTTSIKAAIHCANPGDTIKIPRGLYAVNDTLEINKKTLKIEGQGIGSGIIQMNKSLDLLRITDTIAPRISDIFLGGRNPNSGETPALLRMKLVRYGRFDNVVLQGAHTGISLEGSLSNAFYDIKSSANIREPFTSCPDKAVNPGDFVCHNHQWISSIDYLPSNNPIIGGLAGEKVASNANRYYNLQLEGGTDGFKYVGSLGQGGSSFHGGIISTSGENDREGVAFNLKNTGQPILIEGMHIEANNIFLETTQNVTIESSMISGIQPTTTKNRKTGRVCLRSGAVNTSIQNSTVEAIDVHPSLVTTNPKRYQIKNSRLGLATSCEHTSTNANELCLNERISTSIPVIDGCPP